jgi:hypothetical protein
MRSLLFGVSATDLVTSRPFPFSSLRSPFWPARFPYGATRVDPVVALRDE